MHISLTRSFINVKRFVVAASHCTAHAIDEYPYKEVVMTNPFSDVCKILAYIGPSSCQEDLWADP